MTKKFKKLNKKAKNKLNFILFLIIATIIGLPTIFANVNDINASVLNYHRYYNISIEPTGNESDYNCNFTLFNKDNSIVKTEVNNSVGNATEWLIEIGYLNPEFNNYTYFVNCTSKENSSNYTTKTGSFEVNNAVSVNFAEVNITATVDKTLTLNLSNKSIFNIDDKENDDLEFRINTSDANLGATLNNNILTLNPNKTGNYQIKIDVSDVVLPRIWKQFTINVKVESGFEIQSLNNKSSFVFGTLPKNISVIFKIKDDANFQDYSCKILKNTQTIKSLNVSGNQEITALIEVDEFKTYNYEIECYPLINEENVEKVSVEYYVEEINSELDFPEEIILNEDGEKERGKTVSESFKIKNEGTVKLDIKIIIPDEIVEIEGHNDSYEFSLDPSESRTLDIEGEVSYDYNSGIVDLGNLKLEITNSEYEIEREEEIELKMFVPSLITLESFIASSDRARDDISCSDSCFSKEYNTYELKSSYKLEVEPNDDIEMKVEVKANTLDMRDVYARLEIDDWDIEEESEEYDINSDDERTFTFNIKSPLRIQEDDEVEYKITISGRDDEVRSKQEITIYGKFLVTKSSNKIYVDGLEIAPKELQCYDLTYLNGRIINIGRNDMNIEYRISGTNFEYRYEEECDLQEYNNDEDDYCDINLPIDTSDLEPGNYRLKLEVYDGSKLINGPFYLEFTKKECEFKKTQPSEAEKNETSTNIVITEEPTEIPTIDLTTKKGIEINKETVLIAAIVVTSVAVLAMVFALIKLLI